MYDKYFFYNFMLSILLILFSVISEISFNLYSYIYFLLCRIIILNNYSLSFQLPLTLYIFQSSIILVTLHSCELRHSWTDRQIKCLHQSGGVNESFLFFFFLGYKLYFNKLIRVLSTLFKEINISKT